MNIIFIKELLMKYVDLPIFLKNEDLGYNVYHAL